LEIGGMYNTVHWKTLSIRRRLSSALIPICLVAAGGCAGQFPGAPAAGNQEPEGCRVTGRIVSTAWRDLGGGIERAIVRIWTVPESERVEEAYGEGEEFEIRLAPGKYRLVCSAIGTRGATFEVQSREITVTENRDRLDVGEVDLPISKTTGLYGKPAPELEGITAWQDTAPIALKDLRGKVVVLDFFAYYCSICHEHKPDLVKLGEKYGRHGLVVLAVHDSSLKTLHEMNAKIGPVLRRVFDGNPPKIAIALDGPGEQSVFNAYGIDAVPAVILIDERGRVVRRYHHAGKPELETDVRKLLIAPSKPSL
jgi:thiol-disulfide isomerase/thioredoxin